MRARLTIGVLLAAALAGCGGSTPPAPTTTATAAPAAASPLRCEPWPDGAPPPEANQLLRSAEESLPGTHASPGAPVSVVVGDACVTLPGNGETAAVYCGAADGMDPPRPCVVGEECAVGSIMVTDVARYPQPDGLATCATFENWSRNTPRSIYLWAKPR